jgi:hypothetical protein
MTGLKKETANAVKNQNKATKISELRLHDETQ